MDAVSSVSQHTNFVNTPSENAVEHPAQSFVGGARETVGSVNDFLGFPLERRVITGRTPSSTSNRSELRDELIEAVLGNQVDTVKDILFRGLTPELCWSRDGKNPLTFALKYGRWEIAMELLNAGWTTEDAIALNNLGWMHANGKGGEQNYAAALEWFRKAADHGSTMAQTNLDWMYEQGHGHKGV